VYKRYTEARERGKGADGAPDIAPKFDLPGIPRESIARALVSLEKPPAREAWMPSNIYVTADQLRVEAVDIFHKCWAQCERLAALESRAKALATHTQTVLDNMNEYGQRSFLHGLYVDVARAIHRSVKFACFFENLKFDSTEKLVVRDFPLGARRTLHDKVVIAEWRHQMAVDTLDFVRRRKGGYAAFYKCSPLPVVMSRKTSSGKEYRDVIPTNRFSTYVQDIMRRVASRRLVNPAMFELAGFVVDDSSIVGLVRMPSEQLLKWLSNHTRKDDPWRETLDSLRVVAMTRRIPDGASHLQAFVGETQTKISADRELAMLQCMYETLIVRVFAPSKRNADACNDDGDDRDPRVAKRIAMDIASS
jgi:hypothetical protein